MKEITNRNYLLMLLLAILASNQVDRVALGLLLQDIKVDLALTDIQLGILTGIAFALFYSVMGVPMARWADRGDRIAIISITTAIWSVAVALCGMATTFVQLVGIRIGVAIGEAGCIPPAHSLIADHFTQAERPRAVSRYLLGAPLSVLIGYFLAGWLSEWWGWRATFVVLGLPGLGLAALAWASLRDPRRHVIGRDSCASTRSDKQSSSTQEYRLSAVFSILWGNRTFRHLLISYSVISFFGYGLGQWQPAFFIRSYGMQPGELGTWFAVIYGAGGILGMYWGGELASRYAAKDECFQLKVMAVAYSFFGVVSACIYVSSNRHVAFGLMTLSAIGGSVAIGPLFAAIQTLVPERMRAVSIALIYLFANLIGMGLGPLAAGILSDVFRPALGNDSLRFALLALCPGYFWGAWHVWRASRTVTQDLQVLQVPQDALEGRATVAEPSNSIG